jgi:hypothetical protein
MEKKEIRSRKCLLLSVLLALIVLCSTSVFGATIRVPTDYPTIQAGIDAAVGGDIVIVADGTYVGSGNKDLDFKGKAITVKSENGPDNCVIDCQGNGRGFHFYSYETQSSVVSGFTITNGHAKYGGAIECNTSSPTITNCKIIGNTADNVGGGIRCGSGWWSSCTITNCIIIGNTALWGGGIYLNDARAQITNSTITGNTASYTGGGMRISASPATITNSILWGNTPSELSIDPGGVPATPTISYCDIKSYEHTDPTTIHTDPLFVDVSGQNPAEWDLHLQSSSPCIDTGSNVAPGLPATDFEGDPRKIDGDGDGTAIADMGADEYVFAITLAEIIGTWSSGIWYRDEAASTWTHMTPSTPDGDIAAGDFTGDGTADVASCWGSGLWYQDGDTSAWTKVAGTTPDSVAAGDVTGDGRSEIIGTWSSGIWYRDVAASDWTRMSSSTPTGDIAAGDFTGDGKADVASIWSSGLWYQDGASLAWTKVGSAPHSLAAGDVTGDGRFEIIGSWSNGVWYWDVAASEWTKMTASAPTGDIAAGDFTSDGKADVVSCWGNGLWYQDGATLGWTKVSNTAPTQVTAGDLTGD